MSDRRVEIDNVRRLLLLMEVRIQTLHEGSLSRAGHTYHRQIIHRLVSWLRQTQAREKQETNALPMTKTTAGVFFGAPSSAGTGESAEAEVAEGVASRGSDGTDMMLVRGERETSRIRALLRRYAFQRPSAL